MTSLNIAHAASGPWPIACGAPLRWFLVRAKPSAEAIAQVNLERQGYRVYYPRLLRPTLYRGRWIDRIVGLFPRYLFVQLDMQRQSLAPVRSTTGVANIVSFGAQTAMVADTIVNQLIGRADPQSGLHKLNEGRRFKSGSPVTIIAGTFEGIEGIFERDIDAERVVVLLKLLGRETPVRIPARFVLPTRAR